MLSFSNCKINIGLYITGKRNDGFHNIETIFFPLAVHDVLEILVSEKTTLSIFGKKIPGAIEDNIILKAYGLVKKDFSSLPPVHFCLLKNIPAGAGLGAGSANGAFTLIDLNKKFSLNLTKDHLLKYASELGSDCPFFIINEPAIATGRGEILETIHLNLSGYKMVIVNPGIHISTPWAFKQITPQPTPVNLKKIITQPVEQWKNYIENVFENAVIKDYPAIKKIKEYLYNQGASYASMSGSGSTLYGIFRKEMKLNFAFPENYFVKIADL